MGVTRRAEKKLPGLHAEAPPEQWPDWTDEVWEPAMPEGGEVTGAEVLDIIRGARAERICRSLAARGLAGAVTRAKGGGRRGEE